MDSGFIFTRIGDESIRSAILIRLLEVNVCLPSIDTFHEDTKWLEPCSVAIREHIVSKSSSSLFQSLCDTFKYKQAASDEEEDCRVNGLEEKEFTLACRRLFAFAWRYFPDLSGISPKQSQGGPKQLLGSPNDLLHHEFRKYAAELGFKSSKSTDDVAFYPETVMIRKFLLNVRPPELFRPQQAEEQLISKIYNIIEDCYQRFDVVKCPANHESSLNDRCGRPNFKVWNSARMFFKYEYLYGSSTDGGAIFADQRDIFVLFFGKHNGDLSLNDMSESTALPIQSNSAQPADPANSLTATHEHAPDPYQIQA